jgi:general secretion pathway protein I
VVRSKGNSGFTLIEVLVALAILSIALTALIKASAQNIKDTIYLQNKTIAQWVGLRVINEARIGLLKLPANDTTDMLGTQWSWQAMQQPSKNPHIAEIHVTVKHLPDNVKLLELVSYAYVA